jgi:hypothetical protein
VTWRPRALIIVGAFVCVAAVALAALGATLRGAFNPECDNALALSWHVVPRRMAVVESVAALSAMTKPMCGAPWQARVLLLLALPVGIYGGILVAMGIVRAQPDERERTTEDTEDHRGR